MRPKRYIVWFRDKEIDLNDPFQKKWFIEQVLTYGKAEDIRELNWEEIEELLPHLRIPERVRSLWEDYFRTLGKEKKKNVKR